MKRYSIKIEDGGAVIIIMDGQKEIAAGITTMFKGWENKAEKRRETITKIVARLNGEDVQLPGRYYKVVGRNPMRLYEYGEYTGGMEGYDDVLQEVCEIENKKNAELLLSALVAPSATSLAASILGRKGGKAKSEKKTAAVRENAKKGGRPKTVLCPRCEMVKIKIDDAAGTCKFCQEEMETEIKRSQENYDRAMK